MKDDKKKLLVIGVLALAIVAIGAFQMTAGGKPSPAIAVTKKADATTTGKKGDATAAKDPNDPNAKADPPKNPTYATNLPERDPFDVPAGAKPKAPDPVKTPTPPPSTASPKWRAGQGGPRFTGPYTPPGLEGQLPGAEGAPGGVAVTKTGPPPDAFNYQVSGVIVGAKRMAVFTDPQGNQRLVALGGSIDGDSKVVGIEKGKVTVVHRGKTLQLVLGGNPSEK